MALPFQPSDVEFAEVIRRQGEILGATIYFKNGTETVIEADGLTEEVKQFLTTFNRPA